MVNEFFSAIILAIVQGFTEWLPISSSGHLVLVERLFDYKVGLIFDVALHFGTLMAVFVYFGKDIVDIIEELLKGKFRSEKGRMGVLLIIASLPAALFGFFAKSYFDSALSNLGIIASGFALTGMFLLIASVPGRVKHEKLGFRGAFFIGVAQALSIIPGISRSGSTISSGIMLGLNEKEAMKFSFLLSIPVVFGANLITIGNNTLPPDLIWAALASFIVGIVAIHLIFNYILVNRKSFMWFGLYCLLLATSIGIYMSVA